MVINRFSQWLQETDYFPDGVTSDMLPRLELRNAQAILARRSSKENLQPVSGESGALVPGALGLRRRRHSSMPRGISVLTSCTYMYRFDPGTTIGGY